MSVKAYIDRIEEGQAVVIDENETSAIIPVCWIPGAYDGMAVTLSFAHDKKREEADEKEAEILLREVSRGK